LFFLKLISLLRNSLSVSEALSYGHKLQQYTTLCVTCC